MTTPASRRNGKPASCEPCRRGKIRCDHGQPVCGRCQHRGLTAKCFYHPAPLTKPRGSGLPRQGSSSSHLVAPINNAGLTGPYTTVNASDEAVQYDLRAGNESDVRRSQFLDSDVNFRRRIDEILEVLQPLRNLEEIQRLVVHYTSTAQVGLVPAPIMLHATSTLFETSREVSQRQRSVDVGAIQEFATAILYNTSSPVPIHADLEYEAFVDIFTGTNLRLELLGIIYTVAARARVYELPLHGDQSDPLLYQLFKAGQCCLNLARELAPTVNDVIIWVSFEITRLCTNAQGDSHPNVWRYMGDTISDAYIMEIHREARVAKDAPFWLAECRRKNWAVIYHWDKSVATFFQRPPRISKRYADSKLPLDLTDSELFGSPAALNEARSKLTPEGWNPTGAYCSTTWYRLRCIASRLLEDQWSYKDRPHTASDILQLEQLAEKCQTIRSSFPQSLQYNLQIWDSSTMKQDACFMLAIIHLLFLHNDLQVHIMLMRSKGGYTGTTLGIACEIVMTVNHLGQVRDRDRFLQHDNAYVMLCYGLPAASILVPALSETKRDILPPSISRSKLIRDLAVFIGYLERICKKGDPNYGVCIGAARVFERALDGVLDPKGGRVGQQEGGGVVREEVEDVGGGFGGGEGSGVRNSVEEGAGEGVDVVGMNFEGLEEFDLESWMQSVDWSSIGAGEYTF